MQKVLENRCQSCKKSDNIWGKYTSRAISPICCSPAVLIEGHDEALVLDAGDGGVVAVLARENLLSTIFLLATDVRVLRPVEPE